MTLIIDNGPQTEPLSRIDPEFYAVHRERISQPPSGLIRVPPVKRIKLLELPPHRIVLSDHTAGSEAAKYFSLLTSTIPTPSLDDKQCNRVLHLGCRNGDWAIEMARKHPTTWFLGIDENPTCIDRAVARALDEGLANLEFRKGDITYTCIDGIKGYEKRPFDVVYASFIGLDIDATKFSDFVCGLIKLCTPEGTICWSEMELPITNSVAVERFNRTITDALRLAGRTFGAGSTIGITPLMGSWLRYYGCRAVHGTAHIDISYGTPMRDHYIGYMEQLGKILKFYVVGTGVASEQEYRYVLDRALGEMVTLIFCGLVYLSVSRISNIPVSNLLRRDAPNPLLE